MTGWALVAIVAIVIWGVVQIFTRRNDHTLGVTRDEDGNLLDVIEIDEEESKA